jgi:hypothetical protein
MKMQLLDPEFSLYNISPNSEDHKLLSGCCKSSLVSHSARDLSSLFFSFNAGPRQIGCVATSYIYTGSQTVFHDP